MLTVNDRLLKLATADARTLARVDAVLCGEDTATAAHADDDLRAVTFTDAARHLSCSRCTVHMMVRSGRLPVVVLNGSRRIPMRAIAALVSGEREPDRAVTDRIAMSAARRRDNARRGGGRGRSKGGAR